ncbi:MAG: M20/M25/M40 family metallo-hydrolase [Planctomycetota bacterium]
MAAKFNLDLLRKLCETPGVPGREERVRDLIQKEIKGLFDAAEIDSMGTLICRRKPRTAAKPGSKKTTKKKTSAATDPKVVMLLCHMDEIGFYVQAIDDNGFVRIDPAGGFDPRNLFSRRVLVCTEKGDLPGVMNPAGRPVHISSAEERKKVPEVNEFFVDVGMPKEEVEKKVRVGDYIVMDEPLKEVGSKIVSKALDNRVACWLGIESVRKLEETKAPHACEIVVAFTVQEEVGLRGAKTSAFAVRPDVGIGIDVTLACDTPGVPSNEMVSKHGEGFALHVKDGSFISDYALVEQIEGIARKKKIKHQRSILARGGQDGAAAQQAAAGAKAVGITVGTRYIHTVTEMIDRNDLTAARDILSAYLAEA